MSSEFSKQSVTPTKVADFYPYLMPRLNLLRHWRPGSPIGQHIAIFPDLPQTHQTIQKAQIQAGS